MLSLTEQLRLGVGSALGQVALCGNDSRLFVVYKRYVGDFKHRRFCASRDVSVHFRLCSFRDEAFCVSRCSSPPACCSCGDWTQLAWVQWIALFLCIVSSMVARDVGVPIPILQFSGDSYTTVGFNSQLPTPTDAKPLGVNYPGESHRPLSLIFWY